MISHAIARTPARAAVPACPAPGPAGTQSAPTAESRLAATPAGTQPARPR